MFPSHPTASTITVFVQRPGEMPEEYESYPLCDQAEACRSMLRRSEPSWRVWVG